MNPQWVTAHLASGDFPALVVRSNPDGSKNVQVFTDTEMIGRMSMQEYLPDPDDDEDTKVGMWSA